MVLGANLSHVAPVPPERFLLMTALMRLKRSLSSRLGSSSVFAKFTRNSVSLYTRTKKQTQAFA